MGIFTSRTIVDDELSKETLLQSKIYEEGKREGREEGREIMKHAYETLWKEWMDREIARRMEILYTEGGYDTVQMGFRPTKEDTTALTTMLLSPQYPLFKKIILGYAQNAYRMAGAMGNKNPDDSRMHACLGNLLTGFLSALEALAMKQEVAPKDEWSA